MNTVLRKDILKNIFKAPALRAILLTSLVAAISFSLWTAFYTIPSFTNVLKQTTEKEAVRTAQHLLTLLFEGNYKPGKELYSPLFLERIYHTVEDHNLEKLKIFSSSGKVLFSTEAGDIGNTNTNTYFFDFVAKGNVFTKIVKKDTASLEGRLVSRDVVETYVPIMHQDVFSGAFEIYYDITEAKDHLDALVAKTLGIQVTLAVILLSAVVIILTKASRSMIEQAYVEEALRVAHSDLEKKVDQRTAALRSSMENLEESERRFRTIFESVSDGLLITDADTKMFLKANIRICQMLGYTEQELLSKGLESISPEDKLPQFMENLERQGQGKISLAENVPVLREDGEIFYSDIASAKFDFSGRLCFIRSFRDVTERMKLQNAIAGAKRDWEETFDTINDAITVHDKDFTVVRANKAAMEMLGLSNINTKQQKCFMVYHSMECPPEGCAGSEVMQTGKPVILERFEPHLGKFLEIKALPRIDSAGTVLGLVHIVRDVTEKKKVEEELRKAYEGLETTVEERTWELKEANSRLEELDKMKSMFIASMSHELRTPLNAILGFTGVMLQGLPGNITAEQKKQLTLVKKSAMHLLALINDIIDVSKLETGLIKPTYEEFDAAALTGEIAESLKFMAEKKELRLTSRMPDSLFMRSDKTRVRQVITNLLGNAIKFTARGEVEVTMKSKEGEGLVISIRDSGRGISQKEMANLFRPFSRVHDEREKLEGTGLGLYLSSKLMDLLGGEIRVESEFGKGSTFSVDMPFEPPPSA